MTNDRNFCVYSQDKFMSNRKMWVKRNYQWNAQMYCAMVTDQEQS